MAKKMSSRYDKIIDELNRSDGLVWSECSIPSSLRYGAFVDDNFSFGDIEGIVVDCLTEEKDRLTK